MKSWRRQALFEGRHCFCPTPTLGGGGSSQGGRHPLTALSIVPTHLWYIQLRGGIDISFWIYSLTKSQPGPACCGWRFNYSSVLDSKPGPLTRRCNIVPLGYRPDLGIHSSGTE